MLGIVSGQFFELNPTPVSTDNLTIFMTANQSHIQSWVDGRQIKVGPRYHSMNDIADIHPISGEITVKLPGTAKFRAIFGNFHRDISVSLHLAPSIPSSQ
jgi:hypothetical protein